MGRRSRSSSGRVAEHDYERVKLGSYHVTTKHTVKTSRRSAGAVIDTGEIKKKKHKRCCGVSSETFEDLRRSLLTLKDNMKALEAMERESQNQNTNTQNSAVGWDHPIRNDFRQSLPNPVHAIGWNSDAMSSDESTNDQRNNLRTGLPYPVGWIPTIEQSSKDDCGEPSVPAKSLPYPVHHHNSIGWNSEITNNNCDQNSFTK